MIYYKCEKSIVAITHDPGFEAARWWTEMVDALEPHRIFDTNPALKMKFWVIIIDAEGGLRSFGMPA